MKKYLIVCLSMFLFLSFFGCAEGKKNNKPLIAEIKASPIPPISPGASTTITVTAVDEDDDELDYDWEASGGRLNNNSGKSVLWTAPDNYGNYHVEVTVDDGEDRTHGGYTVSVSDQPSITSISRSPDQSTYATLEQVELTVNISPVGKDFDILWEDDGGTLDSDDESTVTWTAPAISGTFSVTVTVTDGISSDSYTIEIKVV